NEYATRKALMRAQERNVSSALTADIIGRNADAICAMGMNAAVTYHWQTHNERGLVLQDIAQSRSAVISGITRSLRMLLQIIVLAFGAWFTLHGELSSGGLIAVSILIQRALSPFDQAIMLWKQFIGARDSYRRLHKLLELTMPPAGATMLPTPTGRLTA
ncbi:type I secretion system permease/ATPase, partial [Bradyrhizobium sp. WBAH41]|nr:type I secretion system permease/ATPase [Bradyrhizobium sp. WBAH41]